MVTPRHAAVKYVHGLQTATSLAHEELEAGAVYQVAGWLVAVGEHNVYNVIGGSHRSVRDGG